MPKHNCLSDMPGLTLFKLAFIAAVLHIAPSALAQSVLGSNPETSAPVHVSQGATPLVLLTMARDHSLFFGAYNDLTDLKGQDGSTVFNFKPRFEYIGLFNSAYCYIYNGNKDSTNKTLDSYFTPDAAANPLNAELNPGGCTGSRWSGNWLNYVTTSRIDALRVALYGGHRVIDRNGNQGNPNTLLRRAYIPQDGHTWAKEYTNIATDGYDIRQYTPFAMPSSSPVQLRHFFGNLTSTVTRDVALTSPYADNLSGRKNLINGATRQVKGSPDNTRLGYISDPGKSCAALSDCSDYPPVMRIVLNAGSRVWRWAASQKPVMDYHPFPIGDNPGAFISPNYGNYEGYGNLYDDLARYVSPQPAYPTDYTVQVEVCTPNYRNGCKQYGSGGTSNWKPIGVLHEYGENGRIKFGLLTGSYDKNLSGGRLRKNIGFFSDEIVANTGQFAYKTDNALNSLIKQIDNIRIRNFNNPTDDANPIPNLTNRWASGNFIYKNQYSAAIGDGTEGQYADWGNPMAEMMYEGMRYFSGAGPTPEYAGNSENQYTEDRQVGMMYPNWTNPYSDSSKWCAKPNLMVVSGPYISSDSDQLPGSRFPATVSSSLRDTGGSYLDVSVQTNIVSQGEGINNTSRFIGEVVGSPPDYSPTLKTVSSLSDVRGLAPNNPASQGSFYSAGVSYFGKTRSLQTVGGKNIPLVDTYSILLPSPDSAIKIPFSSGRFVTVEPFAKKINVSEGSSAKGQYQSASQMAGVYVTQANTTPDNFHLKFYVNFDNQSSGGDFEMDSTAYYEIDADATNVRVTVTDNANDGSSGQNMGYFISGTTADGPYLVVQDRASDPTKPQLDVGYFLNVPPPEGLNTFRAGYCDSEARSLEARCKVLPNKGARTSSSIVFTPIDRVAAAPPLLKHPLWYAARWGGLASGSVPAPLPSGQDPDNYAQLSSPAALKAAFSRMFDSILNTSSTQGSMTSNSQQLQTSTQIYTTSFNAGTLYGELTATPFTVTQGSPSDLVSYGEETTANANMPAYQNRNIYFNFTGNRTEFTYANVNNSYSGALTDQEMVDYLRGDRSREMKFNGAYRNRQTVMGTTVNSTPLYSQDTGMVYVGANDGMVHAFDAATLVERFAFIPTSVLTTKPTQIDDSKPNLSAWGSLAKQATASHRFFVDGDLAITDASNTSDSYMAPGYNYLVGFLGRGGKGLFGLPVKSYSINAPGLKESGIWEKNGTADVHMGYLLGKPIIEQLPDGTNVVIFGNGYNSTNEQAVLYVLRASDGVEIARFITCNGKTVENACNAESVFRAIGTLKRDPNGLATPGVVRRGGKVEFVFAGDYLGNVWSFDLRGFNKNTTGRTYYPTDADKDRRVDRFFEAKTSAGIPQPIVAPIISEYSWDFTNADTRNKQYVWFGTGSDLTSADLATTTTQSMYGLIVSLDGTLPNRAAGNLTQRRVLTESTGTFTGYKTVDGTLPVRAFSTQVPNDMSGKLGWYMDWTRPAGENNGPVEQVFNAAAFRSTVTPAIVVSSVIPNSNSCVSTGAGYLNAMDAYSGGSLPFSLFDINRNGVRDETFTPANGGNALQVSSIDLGIGAIGGVGFAGANVIAQGTGASTGKTKDNLADVGLWRSRQVSRRTSWREITATEP